MDKAQFEAIVARANLAPSIHNVQPTRWRLRGDVIEVAVDRTVQLPAADPSGESVGLSCGAAVEATAIALSLFGIDALVTDLWDENNIHHWAGHRMGASIKLTQGAVTDPLSDQLEQRFTWRGAFDAAPVRLFGWNRDDTVMVLDAPTRAWLAGLNDAASLGILRDAAFRQELLGWMRLEENHPRFHVDGLSRAALRMDPKAAGKVALGFGAMWKVLDTLGRTAKLTAEADLTMTAPVIACIHRPKSETALQSGRAYLRMCLEAAHLGLAAWPMAALSDDPEAAAQITAHFTIGAERNLLQVLRLGVPTGEQTPRARRPLSELIAP